MTEQLSATKYRTFKKWNICGIALISLSGSHTTARLAQITQERGPI